MAGPNGPVRARASRGGTAGVLVAAALLAGCTWRGTPATTTTTRAPGTPGTQAGKFTAEATRVQATTPDTRPWFCNSVGTGTPASGHGNGSHVDPAYAGRTKGPLEWTVCLQLAAQLDRTLDTVRGLETRAKGEAAGWLPMGGYIAGLGTHHGKFANLANRPFDPATPTFLIYGGKTGDAPLVGVAWRVSGNQPAPPEAYVGGNDWYHKHMRICNVPGLAGGEELTDEQSAALGGTNVTIPGGGDYLLHVWLIEPYEYRPDIFVSGHPCLLADGIAPFTDPCWDLAHHDPSLGPPPAPGTGDHDSHAH